MLTLIVIAAGLAVGSFLNVVITRTRSGEGYGGRSRCAHCERKLLWYELVPVVSFVMLGGRCGTCGNTIGPRYLFVELAAATGFFALALRYLPDDPRQF